MQPAIVCFSHLRWDFVYQRPQHILSRLAKDHRVFYVEEPVLDDTDRYYYEMSVNDVKITVIVPHVPHMASEDQRATQLAAMTDHLLKSFRITDYVLWYYAPMAYAFTQHLSPAYIVYDCMDELSAFLYAPPALRENEAKLIDRANIVFTGGYSLYSAKKHLHKNIHCFPSSIDKQHFMTARGKRNDPPDQVRIPYPRIGFFGVIDERMDIGLLKAVAEARPNWQFILVGPVVKIDRAGLPQAANIHYLDKRPYTDLPAYLSGWDIAMMPFANNASTKFISPTKTPEYLAGGKPVIAPSITDVVRPYGELGLVTLADTPEEFLQAAEYLLDRGPSPDWLTRVDNYLRGLSWDDTVIRMRALIDEGTAQKTISKTQQQASYV